MRPSLVFILTAIFAILQITVMDYFKFFGAKPDLILTAALIGGLFLNLKFALGLGVSAGIFKDVFSLNALGLNAVLLPIWIFLIKKLIRRVAIEDNLSRTLLVFSVSLLNNIISGLVLIYSGPSVPPLIFLRIVILSSIYTASVFYLTVRFIAK